MEIASSSPDEFLAAMEDAVIRSDMIRLDEVIVDSLPERRRVLWQGTFWGGTEQSIIGYGQMIQPRPRGEDVDWFLAGLARQKANYSIYLNAVEDGGYLGHLYADRLGKVKMGSASIGFRSLDDIDLDVLAEMLRHADRITPPDPG